MATAVNCNYNGKLITVDEAMREIGQVVEGYHAARVLRGVLLGLELMERFGAPIAPSLAQSSMVMIRDGVETLVIDVDGAGERA